MAYSLLTALNQVSGHTWEVGLKDLVVSVEVMRSG